MATITLGSVTTFRAANACTVTITPGTGGSVRYWADSPDGLTRMAPTVAYSAVDFTVTADATIWMEAVGVSGTYTGASDGTGSPESATATYNASSVDLTFYVAPRAMLVTGINCRPTVAGTDAGAVTAVIRKVPSGTAITSGTALHSSSFNLKGTANTNQALTLSTTGSNLLLAAGDALAVDFTGTLTSATGSVTVALIPVA